MPLLLASLLHVTSFQTGNSLYPSCIANGCQSYIIGAADALLLEQAAWKTRHFCLPAGVTQGQIGEIGLNYIRDHPEDRQLAAVDLINSSLEKAFPCPVRRGRKHR
jgi:hypothetical protein